MSICSFAFSPCHADLFSSVPDVLKEYEDAFFQVVHPKYNLFKLVRKNVITEDLASRISATTDDEGRELLYHHLKHHGSVQTLREFCEVAVAADGYPNMQKLAEKMLHVIPTDSLLCMCASVCAFVCVVCACKHSISNARMVISGIRGVSKLKQY